MTWEYLAGFTDADMKADFLVFQWTPNASPETTWDSPTSRRFVMPAAERVPVTPWSHEYLARELTKAKAECDRLREALERIAKQQPKTLAMIKRNGFVFEDIGHEPGNWQHLAFSIYADLCETDAIARSALKLAPERSGDG